MRKILILALLALPLLTVSGGGAVAATDPIHPIVICDTTCSYGVTDLDVTWGDEEPDYYSFMGTYDTTNQCQWFTKRHDRVAKTVGGVVVLRYRQIISWCGNGSVVKQFRRQRINLQDTWPWDFVSHTYSNCNNYENCQGLAGGFSAAAKTQGHYRGCVTVKFVTYCRDLYPYIVQTGYAGGGYTWRNSP